jgi:hypothetical protein
MQAATRATAAATVNFAVFTVVTAWYAHRAPVTQSAQRDGLPKELQQAAAGWCSSEASKALAINAGTADLYGDRRSLKLFHANSDRSICARPGEATNVRSCP